MTRQRRPRMGEIFWLRDCPALEGEGVKDRPVVVIVPPGRDDVMIVVVACTTRYSPNHEDAVELPNAQTHPRFTSGLQRHTWAIPKWYFAVKIERLGGFVGNISGATLKRVALAVEARMKEPGRNN